MPSSKYVFGFAQYAAHVIRLFKTIDFCGFQIKMLNKLVLAFTQETETSYRNANIPEAKYEIVMIPKVSFDAAFVTKYTVESMLTVCD